jgi:hypothetical protein
MNHYFNLNDISGFLENLTQIEKIKSMSNTSKENDKKKDETQHKRYLTIQDLYTSFFEQSRNDRNLLSDELDFIYCCLSIMLGFSLKSKPIVEKKIDTLSNILKMKEEKNTTSDEKKKEIIDHMKQKLNFFKLLANIVFNSKEFILEKPLDEEKNLTSDELNLLALKNMQNGDLNKSQLLFKRALLRAKLQNKNMTTKEYIDDIYNTNTDTKIYHQKMASESNNNDFFQRKTHNNEEYLLYNSALLLIKRQKYLEAVEIFQNVKKSFHSNPQFWYRYGQASKGIFLQDVGHVSRLYDYYFHHKKKKFYSYDRKFDKGRNLNQDNYFDDFINFYTNLTESYKKNSKLDIRKLNNNNLKEILVRKKLVTMFKAKDLLSLTNKLYSQNSK